ncbi:MAG: mammalian cell entry protein [Fibrobacter sp.]|nr:mammalian cell entry protein [Fibrobacter sp.]
MKISDRTIGYLSLLTLLLIFAAVAIGMYQAHHEEAKCIYVDFNELGTLQPQDQVVVKGYTVGVIGDIAWLGDRARVQVKFIEPIIIREGTQFYDVNYALMGQRRLEIIPSKTGKILPDSYIHTGVFEPGIAEVLRLIDGVNEQLLMVRDMVRMLTDGDSTHASVQQTFEEVLQTVEITMQNTEKMIASLQPTVNKIFNNVDSTTKILIDATNQIDTTLKTANSTVNEKLVQAEEALKTVSEGIQSANDLISNLESNPDVKKILNSTEVIEKTNVMVAKLTELLKSINTKGLTVYDDNGKPVKLIPFRNMNIIGKTAREKAAERAAKGESLD